MTLLLEQGTKPNGLGVKTIWPFIKEVMLGDYEISMEDFNAMVMYVMTNSDLTEDDPRYKLLMDIKKLRVIEGHNPGNKKLGYG